MIQQALIQENVITDGEKDEYLELAKGIGYEPPLTNETAPYPKQLVDCLKELGLPIYDPKKVLEFLIEKAAPYKKKTLFRRESHEGELQIGWKGIISYRKDSLYIPQIVKIHKKDLIYISINHGGIFSKSYTRPIPKIILRSANEIKKRIPESQFYVSDYLVYRPDPFMAVGLPGSRMIVYDYWDEPSFKP